MLTAQRRAREIAARWIDTPAQCLYNGKLRKGKIVALRQGPARWDSASNEYSYEDADYGEVYVFWLENGYNKAKTFRWDRMQALTSQSVVDKGDAKKQDSITEKFSSCVVVRRVRPVL